MNSTSDWPLSQISRRSLLTTALALPLVSRAANDWTPLFDGRSLDGWKASENTGSWRVTDGLIAADGPRSHLFYTGPLRNGDFKNFEFKADVMTREGGNSGIYLHTQFQQKGFPDKGFEVQVNNTYVGEGTIASARRRRRCMSSGPSIKPSSGTTLGFRFPS